MASATSVLPIIRASRPTFRSKHDKVAFAVHATLMANGLRLLAVGDKTDAADSVDTSEDVAVDGWNAASDQYAFLYALEVDKKVSRLLLKSLPLDGLLLCNLLNMDAPSGAPLTLELDVAQFATDAADIAGSFADLGTLVKRVQGVLEDVTATNQVPPASLAAHSRVSEEPTHTAPPRRGGAGDEADDPLREPLRVNPYHAGEGQGGGMYGGRGGRDPLMIGGRDVVPPGFPAPGERRGPPFGGGGGGFGGGGGMHVGPNDPFFTDRMRHPELMGGGGRGGGGGLGPPGLPPGARWDPISPEGLPGWNPDDLQTHRPPGGGPRPLHPDIQQPGPGRGTDWDSMYG